MLRPFRTANSAVDVAAVDVVDVLAAEMMYSTDRLTLLRGTGGFIDSIRNVGVDIDDLYRIKQTLSWIYCSVTSRPGGAWAAELLRRGRTVMSRKMQMTRFEVVT